jgi:O-antigen/teichoic acid export membrane protein
MGRLQLSIIIPATQGATKGRMNVLWRISLGLVLLGLVAFCVFGFLATFEPLPLPQQWAWRIMYGLVGVSCLLGIVRLLRGGWRRLKLM